MAKLPSGCISGHLFYRYGRALYQSSTPIRDKEKHESDRAFVENQPLDFSDVSCLPWVKYSHFDVHVFDEGKFLAPVITWGKYEMSHGRYMMPLTMNIHHAVADGFHLCRFFNEVQELINTLDGGSKDVLD